MRLFYTFIIIFTLLLSSSDGTILIQDGVDITSDLVALWELDEGTGTTANDTSPNTCGTGDCDGTLENFPASPWTSDGLVCDGGNDVVRIDNSNGVGHSLDFTAGPFTIALRYTTNATPDTAGTLVSKRDGTNDQYQLYIDGSAINLRAGGSIGGVAQTFSGSTTYDIALTVDSSETPEIYVDCVQGTWTGDAAPYTFTHRDVDVSFCARWNTDPAVTFPLDGELKWVRIYDALLSQAQLDALCALGD